MTDQTHAAREARLQGIRDRIRLGGEINSAGVSWILAELSSAADHGKKEVRPDETSNPLTNES